jgi:alpha-amylase/alpha-mannosidase (GH57 family)
MTDEKRSRRYLCLHGHFYQPPRENPWLEAVEEEASAAPFHDWNERILAECYAPNGRSRIQDEQGRIIRFSNNYEKISFNFGPTLLAWMEGKAPVALSTIRKADQRSQEERGGHGNALAQAYNHIILPLARERDILTQIRWGRADFRKRFGREAEGMWLPETAVNSKVLELLAAEGIRFTILAPHQARRIRPLGGGAWMEVNGGINPRRPYLCLLPGGGKIALFFYDGRLAHGIAFQHYLQNGEFLYRELLNAFDPSDPEPQLVHTATDGETYGHHRLFGDMALAYALDAVEKRGEARLTNYGWFLEHFPPRFEVEIRENTSWSCAHGVERWRSDCGCRLGGNEYQQRWRAPLREGLDRLKSELDRLFVEQTSPLLKDPWQARDAYIEVILDRSPERLNRFFEEQARRFPLSREEQIRILKLMEMERFSLLMFTSCGWFFDEISGLETVQVLKYACRAIQIAEDFGVSLEPLLLSYLEKAPSNIKAYGTGARVWEEKVRPLRVDLKRLLAHSAIQSLFEKTPKTRVYCFRVDHTDRILLPQNGNRLAVGRKKVSSLVTLEEMEGVYAVFHFGGVDFQCLIREGWSPSEYESFKEECLRLYKTASLGDVYDWIKGSFPERRFYLKDLLAEERQKLIYRILEEGTEKQVILLEAWVHEEWGTLIRLAQMGVPLPSPLKAALDLIMERDLEKGLREAFAPASSLETLKRFFEKSQDLGFPLPLDRVLKRIERRMEKELRGLPGPPDPARVFSTVSAVLDLCLKAGQPLGLWNLQNAFIDALRRLSPLSAEERPLYLSFGRKIEIPIEVLEREL